MKHESDFNLKKILHYFGAAILACAAGATVAGGIYAGGGYPIFCSISAIADIAVAIHFYKLENDQ